MQIKPPTRHRYIPSLGIVRKSLLNPHLRKVGKPEKVSRQPVLKSGWVSFDLWCEFDMKRPVNARVIRDRAHKGLILRVPGVGVLKDVWDCAGQRPMPPARRVMP